MADVNITVQNTPPANISVQQGSFLGIGDGSITAAQLAAILDLSGKTLTLPSGVVSNGNIAAAGLDTSVLNWSAIAEWQPSTAYAKGALVSYLGVGYRRSAAGTSGTTFNIANWQQITPSTTIPSDASVTLAKLATAVSALLPKAYGQISSTGSLTGGYGITSVSASSNVFTITFDAGVLSSTSKAFLTIGPGGVLGAGARVSSLTAASNQLVVTTHTTTSNVAHPFFIVVI